MGAREGGQVSTPTHPHQIDIDSEAMESVVHEGAQVTKPTLPTRMEIDSGVEVIGVGGARGGRNQTDRLTGVAQDSVLEESATLVKDRKVLTVQAEVVWRRKKTIDWGDGGGIYIREDRTSSAHI